MKQNKYDDPDFFEKYSEMPRSLGGLDAAEEWPVLRAMLPDLHDKRVLDLGCGYGWHCRYARRQQARDVVGIDISEKMLARARQSTHDSNIVYHRSAIEDIDFPADQFDVIMSSLALHYVQNFDLVCRKAHHSLVPGGAFVMSVEHPIFTARAAQDWHRGQDGEPLHWPVDNYLDEGIRHTRWLADDVVKYHRTVATYLNTLLDSGFMILRVAEPGPSPERLQDRPDLKNEHRRPVFLLIAALKTPSS